MKKIALLFFAMLLAGCASTLDERIKRTQDDIDQAISNLGYTRSDILLSQYEQETKTKEDVTHTWERKHLRLRDNYRYDWAELHVFCTRSIKNYCGLSGISSSKSIRENIARDQRRGLSGNTKTASGCE